MISISVNVRKLPLVTGNTLRAKVTILLLFLCVGNSKSLVHLVSKRCESALLQDGLVARQSLPLHKGNLLYLRCPEIPHTTLLFVSLSNCNVALALRYSDNDFVVAHFVTQSAWNLRHSKYMSAPESNLSSDVGLEPPTTDVNASQFPLDPTS